MSSLSKSMQIYHEALDKGDIQKAYRTILGFIAELRNALELKYPECVVSQIYQGFMDMSYFAITPKALRARKLKIALVYLHEANRFELWLSANNRSIQKQTIQYFNQIEDFDYRVSEFGTGIDSIVEWIVHVEPNFEAKSSLKSSLELNVLRFTNNIERFLEVGSK